MSDKEDRQPLQYAKAALRVATTALERMRNAKTFASLEDEWTCFLYLLERVWKITERDCQIIRSKFEPWQEQYKQLRQSDELLNYLRQARDTDGHTINEIVKQQPARHQVTMGLPPGVRGVYIPMLTMKNGKVSGILGDHPEAVQEKTIQPTIEVTTAKNRSGTFAPPKEHLQSELRSLHPTHLAEKGLRFYRRFVSDVEETFFK